MYTRDKSVKSKKIWDITYVLDCLLISLIVISYQLNCYSILSKSNLKFRRSGAKRLFNGLTDWRLLILVQESGNIQTTQLTSQPANQPTAKAVV